MNNVSSSIPITDRSTEVHGVVIETRLDLLNAKKTYIDLSENSLSNNFLIGERTHFASLTRDTKGLIIYPNYQKHEIYNEWTQIQIQ